MSLITLAIISKLTLLALFTFLCILTQDVLIDINYLCFLLSKDPPFSTGLSQPVDLNSENYEELKKEQYGENNSPTLF